MQYALAFLLLALLLVAGILFMVRVWRGFTGFHVTITTTRSPDWEAEAQRWLDSGDWRGRNG